MTLPSQITAMVDALIDASRSEGSTPEQRRDNRIRFDELRIDMINELTKLHRAPKGRAADLRYARHSQALATTALSTIATALGIERLSTAGIVGAVASRLYLDATLIENKATMLDEAIAHIEDAYAVMTNGDPDADADGAYLRSEIERLRLMATIHDYPPLKRAIGHRGMVTTAAEAQAVLARCSMAGAPLVTTLSVEDGAFMAISQVLIVIETVDRDDPTKTQLTANRAALILPMTVAALLALVKRKVVEVWSHEALEFLRIDGVRAYDPHANDPPARAAKET